jgi:hypothetical protein
MREYGKMFVGGGIPTHRNYGLMYDPVVNDWEMTVTFISDFVDFPEAVWTGSELIMWAGGGVRYIPSTDSTLGVASGGDEPTVSQHHTAIWTGSEMIVWGGENGSATNYGARYDPGADSWTATSTGSGCPTGRINHTAVWTGSEMVVWGGDFRNEYGWQVQSPDEFVDGNIDFWELSLS